ncbi:MAG: MarR family transcriptional regulator [Bdellovibrionales bacterium]|nr:MarR family transcriptional regulator [Bdellovibrionales bacterium]
MKKQQDAKSLQPTKCQLVEMFWTFWPAFQRWTESQTTDKKLTPQRTRIMARLQDKGPQIMSELGEYLGVSATNVTELVDALEKEGLVARKPHPSDRRATVIEATKAGALVMNEGCTAYRERVGELFSPLSESDRKELLRLMHVLRNKLEGDSNEK